MWHGSVGFKIGDLLPEKKHPGGDDQAARVAEPALVLVVEDYEDTRILYAEFLAFAGLRTETAATAEEGIAKAFAETPTVIIMDLALPGIDGAEATRRLKADERTKDVPILIVTGHALPDWLQVARDAGADVVLTKPLRPMDLLEKLMPFLQDHSEPTERTTGTRRKKGT
jgi:CheY-like chemotaxis protein